MAFLDILQVVSLATRFSTMAAATNLTMTETECHAAYATGTSMTLRMSRTICTRS